MTLARKEVNDLSYRKLLVGDIIVGKQNIARSDAAMYVLEFLHSYMVQKQMHCLTIDLIDIYRHWETSCLLNLCFSK